jgi:hypothetical protein
MTDRDSHRHGDPLHDTVDEESGVVVDPVDPDDTPIPDLIAMVEQDVGILSGRDKQIIRSIEAHRRRGQERREKRTAPEVDRAKLASLLEHDMAKWPPFKDQAARLAKLEAVEEGRAKALGGMRKWIAGSLGAAVLALGGGLVDYGTRRGTSAAEADRVGRDRAALAEAIAKNHVQETEIGVLKALVQRLEREGDN